MNYLERTKAFYNAAKAGYDLPLLMNEATQLANQNALNAALYEYYSKGQVVFPTYDAERSSKAYAQSDDLYSIVNYIITTAGQVPWKVMVRQSDGTSKPENGALQYLIDNPNPNQGRAQLVTAALGYKLLTGNTYLWAPRLDAGSNKGKTKELHTLPANLVKIKFGTPDQPISGYKLKYSNYEKDDLLPDDVMHSKYFNPDIDTYGDMYGLSPLRAAARKMGISEEGALSLGTSFKNGGPEGIISRDGEEFTEVQSRNLVDRFAKMFSGSRNRGKIAMTGAQIKWTPLGLSPVDLKILETQHWTFEGLRNVYRFPDNLLSSGAKGATFNNKLEAKKQLYTECVIPELQAFLDDFNRWLPMAYDTSGNTYVELDLSGIDVLQEDKKAKAEYLATAWFIPVDRKQEMMGEAVDEKWKGVYMIPNNLIPVKDISDLQPDTSIDGAMKALNHKEYE
jgi:HK97 family phage portal protein